MENFAYSTAKQLLEVGEERQQGFQCKKNKANLQKWTRLTLLHFWHMKQCFFIFQSRHNKYLFCIATKYSSFPKRHYFCCWSRTAATHHSNSNSATSVGKRAQQINKCKLHLTYRMYFLINQGKQAQIITDSPITIFIVSARCLIDNTGCCHTHQPTSTPAGFFILKNREWNFLLMRFFTGNL